MKLNLQLSHPTLWKIAVENAEEVKQWPEWKRAISITSETIRTGEFVKKSKDVAAGVKKDNE